MDHIVPPKWHSVLEKLHAQKDHEKFVSDDAHTAGVIPAPKIVFKTLQWLPDPAKCQVIVIGQDPYPRKSSAIGVAFCDGEVKSWSGRFSPSLRNIMKNLMIHNGDLTPKSPIADLRRALSHHKVLPPIPWFRALHNAGSLWLNTSLTFKDKSAPELRRHIAFWKPVVLEVVRTVFDARDTAGVVFVLWGGKAQALKKVLARIAGTRPVRFVEARHPAVESFHQADSFQMLEDAQKDLGLHPINFLKPE
eukprot:gnl/Dysnectes_brevis/4839_a6701_684.p1 GENE.gnl/Dysnectes_brevis/4839_a6701_684~~gnl/Dysnectes_brevis/4839_a6701_684.p1  ORF type:complete len:268 (-),score=9.12 gnl/Dysnectes_brevis/4839_a6701_684:63-809(-)